MDSVRENLCSKTGVEHCVMPILIHEVGKSWNTGLGQPYSTQQYAETTKGSAEMRTCTRNDSMGQPDHETHKKHPAGSTSCGYSCKRASRQQWLASKNSKSSHLTLRPASVGQGRTTHKTVSRPRKPNERQMKVNLLEHNGSLHRRSK